MNIEELNKDFIDIAEKKITLSDLDYNDEKYDQVEEQLHDLEDQFSEKYGPFIEEALRDIHDEYCPDNDVLMPIAYIANSYIKNDNDSKKAYDVNFGEGVLVDVDDYPGKLTRLVLVPSPTRLILQIDKNNKEEVWRAK